MKIQMFREKIKERMAEIRMPMTRLSMATGIDKSTLSSFLSGTRTISNANLEKIIDVLRLSLVPVQGFRYGYSAGNDSNASPDTGGNEDGHC